MRGLKFIIPPKILKDILDCQNREHTSFNDTVEWAIRNALFLDTKPYPKTFSNSYYQINDIIWVDNETYLRFSLYCKHKNLSYKDALDSLLRYNFGLAPKKYNRLQRKQ